MNNRIKDLAEQAGEYVNSVYTPPVRSRTPGKIWEDGHIGWNEQFQKKFADMIVNHAIECVRDVARDESSDLSWDACSQVQARLREFFGVE
jgi:hypothetical protein